MVQKSGVHQLRLVVYPILYKVSDTSQTVVGLGISEPSTSISGMIPDLQVNIMTSTHEKWDDSVTLPDGHHTRRFMPSNVGTSNSMVIQRVTWEK